MTDITKTFDRVWWIGYVNAAMFASFGMFYAALYSACLTYVGKVVLDAKPDVNDNVQWYSWWVAACCAGILGLGLLPAVLFDFIYLKAR